MGLKRKRIEESGARSAEDLMEAAIAVWEMDDPEAAERWWASLSGEEFVTITDRLDDAMRELDRRAWERTKRAEKSARLRRTLYSTKSRGDSRGESSQGSVGADSAEALSPALRRLAGRPPGKMDAETAAYVRASAAAGESVATLAVWWGVSRSIITSVIAGKTWTGKERTWRETQPYDLLKPEDRPW